MAAMSRKAIVMDLFERYYERVYLFARRSVDPAAAEDVAQEVFVRMLSVADLEQKEISVSYLLKVADNLIKRSHRRRRRLEAFIEQEVSRSSSPAGDNAGRQAGGADDEQRALERAIERLSRGEREALHLIVCRGMSYQAAAASLDVRVSTVNNWKFRGIQKLKQHDAERDQPAARDRALPGQRAG
ncbi:MAG: RNA polymerase sigma factor [Planctomycetota bacterium]